VPADAPFGCAPARPSGQGRRVDKSGHPSRYLRLIVHSSSCQRRVSDEREEGAAEQFRGDNSIRKFVVNLQNRPAETGSNLPCPGLESLASDFLGFAADFCSWRGKSLGCPVYKESAEIPTTFQRPILQTES
jgi:hypothetical protein